jgi:hypothetical protein
LKNKGLLITTFIFFLTINTTYYWEGKLGLFAFPTFLILVVVYLGLGIALLRQIHFAVKEKLADKNRLLNIGVLSTVLTVTFFRPFGLIDFDKLDGEDVLVAQREGAANCITTFKLKKDFTYRERNVCFGVSEVTGTYLILNDTIYFKSTKRGKQEDISYEFAVIEELENYTENSLALKLYANKKDTIGFYYFIGKNELKIKPKKKPNR